MIDIFAMMALSQLEESLEAAELKRISELPKDEVSAALDAHLARKREREEHRKALEIARASAPKITIKNYLW